MPSILQNNKISFQGVAEKKKNDDIRTPDDAVVGENEEQEATETPTMEDGESCSLVGG